jgi:hypothetical protein
MRSRCLVAISIVAQCVTAGSAGLAQTPPSPAEVTSYTGLHAAAAKGDVQAIGALLARGTDVTATDSHGRTPLHVAAHMSHDAAVRALVKGGADPRALESRRYDIVTIAAVKDDVPMLKLALELGGDPKAITSPYDGTALIAAAHLGHDEVVRVLIAAGAPLDHVQSRLDRIDRIDRARRRRTPACGVPEGLTGCRRQSQSARPPRPDAARLGASARICADDLGSCGSRRPVTFDCRSYGVGGWSGG